MGIHLTLNSEWKNYRWGPASGRDMVPTLVDADGYFFSTSEALNRNPVGIDNAELGALQDMNTDGGLPDMSRNRQGELAALTSERFRRPSRRGMSSCSPIAS